MGKGIQRKEAKFMEPLGVRSCEGEIRSHPHLFLDLAHLGPNTFLVWAPDGFIKALTKT